jgi:tetratricopeptide (TPR) repeat protein
MQSRIAGRLGLVLGLWVWATMAWADATLDRAKAYLQQKNPKAAFELLLPLQSQRAGELEYDYLLGISALDAGDPQQAIFALERVLAVNPNYLQARAEIARAYFVVGERENARREFESLKAQGAAVPEEARATIDRYLSALAPQRTFVTGYIAVGGGYDSNVNSATSRTSVALPALGGAIGVLTPQGTRQNAWFLGAEAGLSLSHALTDEWAALAAASAQGKWNGNNQDEFDTQIFDGSAGLRWSRGANTLIAVGQGQRFNLDNKGFRNSWGGTGQWLHALSGSQQLTVFLQAARLDYPTQPVRDADRVVGGLGYSQAFAGPLSPVFFVSGYYGSESTRDASFSYLGHDPLGLRLGGQITPWDRTQLFASFAYEHREYDGQDPTFLVTRRDNQYDVRAGVNYLFAPRWTLTPQVAYTRNDSNIDLQEYDRTVALVQVRRDF